MTRPAGPASRVAIALPADDDVRKVVGDAYDPAKTLNFVKMLAGTEDLFRPAVGLVKALFQTEGIDPKTRQMIVLRAAKVSNAPYQWQANEKLGANVGLTAAEIDAEASDGPVVGVAPDFVLVCKATDELSAQATLKDETLSELLARYGDVRTRKLVLTIGWFNLLSRFLNGCRVPLETTDKVGNKTSPFSEPHVAGYIVTAFDVRVGYLALEKSKTPAVRALAEMMIKDHVAMVEQQTALLKELNITPQESDTSRAVAKMGAERRTSLAALEGAAFDHAFADIEVSAHRYIAGVLQNTLIPAATTPRYKSFLESALVTIKEHEKHSEHLVHELG